MDFNFEGLFRFTYRWLKGMRWTLRRVLIVVAFFVFYPVLEAIIWLGFLIDNLLFRRYHQRAVNEPVFITGMFRSGTTFLHRLMAQDKDRFSTMSMWEILFAPSVTQRRIVWGLAKLLQVPANFILNRVETHWQEQNIMHKVSLREPEEDDYLLLHNWSALTTGLSAGLLDEAMPYTFFDEQLPQQERRRIMAFYHRCVQCHLFAHRAPQQRQYLAKNPALCPKLDSLHEFFPDSKIIYLVRNPLEVIPSFLSMMQFTWRVLGAPAEGPELRDYLLRMARHWYDYPLQYLDQLPEHSYVIVNYDELVRDPAGTITNIYRGLGLDLSPTFADTLQRETDIGRNYQSQHEYSLAELGLSREQIVAEFRHIFDRFGFDTKEQDVYHPVENVFGG